MKASFPIVSTSSSVLRVLLAATALAVLEVIEGEGLMQNAARVGRAFHDGLADLAKTHDALGDIRSAGLFLGVDIVT